MNIPVDILKPSIIILFTTFFFLNYRASIITAISWGAFQFNTNKRIDIKKIVFSIFVIAMVPILIYNALLASLLELFNSLSNLKPILSYFCIVALIMYYGIFPISMKHLWLLVALFLRDTQRKKPTDWLHPSISNKTLKLPLRVYSIQTVVLVGLIIFSILIYQLIYGNLTNSFGYEYIVNVFIIVFTSEIIVLTQIAAKRQYFYPSNQPKLILYPRTVITILIGVLLPSIFGFLYFTICHSYTSYNFFIFIAWPFPIACHSILHLIARNFHWAPIDKHPEIYTEAAWNWYSLAALIPCWIGYAIYLMSTKSIHLKLFGF